MKKTNNPTKKTLTLNKVTVSVFTSSMLNTNNGDKNSRSGNNTTSVTCVTSITL